MADFTQEDLELNRVVLEEITTKWSLLVLGHLCGGAMRFNALRRANEGITQKALTQCLRRLEANGFIKRTVVSTAPVAVFYEVSTLGRSLEPHLRAILKWTQEHREEVMAAQRAFTVTAGGKA
ncbi:winged helix-turn-helix transcriptional regulator [Agrobacterium cavarae]|uniref:winged helix-turn-helix transcriptional regulator n=1 Tax=Agrobacterium cavarae TaxID=2528239 RepID=UPI003FD42929